MLFDTAVLDWRWVKIFSLSEEQVWYSEKKKKELYLLDSEYNHETECHKCGSKTSTFNPCAQDLSETLGIPVTQFFG